MPIVGVPNVGNACGTCRSNDVPIEDPMPIVGVPNVGNTCYMNASLQILAAFYMDKIQKIPPSLKTILVKINAGGSEPVGSTLLPQLIDDLDKQGLKFDGESIKELNQQDAFLFLSGLHGLKPFLPPLNIERYWKDRYKQGEFEVIIDDRIVLNIDCFSHQESTTFKNLINNFFRYRELPNGNSQFLKLGGQDEVLPVYLQRFFIDPKTGKDMKIETRYHGSLLIQIVKFQYVLAGFIMHSGNTGGGHYTAYIKKEDQWYHADDSNITPVTEKEAEKAAEIAYLLFYKKQ